MELKGKQLQNETCEFRTCSYFEHFRQLWQQNAYLFSNIIYEHFFYQTCQLITEGIGKI